MWAAQSETRAYNRVVSAEQRPTDTRTRCAVHLSNRAMASIQESRTEEMVDDTSASAANRIVVRAMDVLQQRLDSAARQITCEYEGGVLLLQCRLSSFYEKQLAQETLRTLEGVDQIVNKIEVDSTI
jgi:osmotically-inducible protein OsmY